ncbi:DUF4190 domain-containing protein [Phytohalomonas tamaricis]|uniref:DUF4190 domain-containing protein n=1 Tax=Phytohalomonas tamaricis TaxID=2081032 RepID=UPI000D0B56D9|nr:DUF4190 domain-containing protein [Phytohalomonas tamaricis]
MAIVSFALAVLGCFVTPAALGGVICGHIARSQLKRCDDKGASWALAGLILSYTLIVLALAGILIFGGAVAVMFSFMALTS